MIKGVRGRGSFAELQQAGRRVRAGALRIKYNADATNVPRLAFSLNRRIGPAVDRNRARRRLRVLFAETAEQRPELVPAGDYLVAVYTCDFTNDEARTWLVDALAQLADPAES